MNREIQAGAALTVGLVALLHRRPELAPYAVAAPLAESVTCGA